MEPALTSGRIVTVVLVTWNSAPYLPRCLAGIAGQSWPDLELIAVDNGSKDGTPEIVRSAFPTCRQIVNHDNRGFTVAVNQGIAAASGEPVLLCNPDAFLERDYIANIVRAFDTAGDRFGMATGKLLRATGYDIQPTSLVDSKGIRMTRTGRHFDIAQGEEDDDAYAIGLRPLGSSLYEVFGVSGAAAVYRMSFLHDVAIDGEVLDEDFFTYREDADVAWRGRVFGWRALYVPNAVGYHVRTVTPNKRRQLSPLVNMHSVKNRFLLRIKNESAYLALRNGAFEIARDLITLAAVLTVERTSLPAFSWLWKNRRRVLAKRREIQRKRRVPDRELADWFR